MQAEIVETTFVFLTLQRIHVIFVYQPDLVGLPFCEQSKNGQGEYHKTLGKSGGFGVRGFFPSGYLPATNGG